MIPAIYFGLFGFSKEFITKKSKNFWDLDGMQDHLINCPTLTKRYNGFLDSDGCPDSFDPILNSDMDKF